MPVKSYRKLSFLAVVMFLFPLGKGICELSAHTIETIAGTGKPEPNGFSGTAEQINIGQPFGVEITPDGSLLICEVQNHRLLRLEPRSGRITTVAGAGRAGYDGDGGAATEASLNEPYEVRLDAMGNIYIVEMRGAVVRRIRAGDGIIETVAGTGEPGFGGDGGPARQAQLNQPHSIALDANDGLYIADIGNHRIRRADLKTGKIESVAGNGERALPVDGQRAKGTALLGPRALYIDGGSKMWIALREGHSVWTLDLDSGILRHVAGTGKQGFQDGPGKSATFNGPKGIVTDGHGNAYVVDTENQAIRRIDARTHEVTTIAGSGPSARGYRGDGAIATEAWLDRPHGIACDRRQFVYIGDTNNHRVRRFPF